jgi:drug/metabolite transporter (DMT)-like permease
MSHVGIGEIYSLSCALLWAVSVVLMKKSGESLAPFALNLFKNLLVLPLFALTLLCVEGPALPPLPLSVLPLVLVSGLLGIAAGDTLYFHALNAIGASRMAVAQTLYSPFVIVLSLTLLHEHLRPPQFAGVALVLGGIALVTWTRQREAISANGVVRGAAYGVLSVWLMAIAVVIAKPLIERYDFLWVVTLRVAGGLAGMLAIVAFKGSARSLVEQYRRVRHWPQVIAGALTGTYLSMMVWLAGYKYTKASIAAVLNEFAGIFIVILAVVFLKERISGRQVLGTLTAVLGVIVVVST